MDFDTLFPLGVPFFPTWFVRDQRTQGRKAAFHVLAALCAHIQPETIIDGIGSCAPSQIILAQMIGVTRQAVYRQIQFLADLGYIEIIHRRGSNKEMLSNYYRIAVSVPSGERPGMEVRCAE